MIYGEDVQKWDAVGSLCPHCAANHRYVVEDATHFAICPRWDRIWQATQDLREQGGMLTAVERGDYVLYGPPMTEVAQPVAVLIWATAVAVMLSARAQDRRAQIHADTRARTARQLVNELHGHLRAECRGDWAAATAARREEGGLRRAPTQSADAEEWASRWAGLAQQQRGRVVWHTASAFDGAAAARDIEESWADGDDWSW